MNDSDRNAPLRPGDLPPPGGGWPAIREFALSFDGHEHARSHRPGGNPTATCNRLARAVRAALEGPDDPTQYSLDDLRVALYWERRAVRWSCGEIPSAETLTLCRRLIECMRRRVEAAASSIPGEGGDSA